MLTNSLPALEVPKKYLESLEEIKRLEWLLANRNGCYASSTVAFLNTSKYHALLVVPKKSPIDRRVVLSKVDEIVYIDNKKYELGTNEYQGKVVVPQGYKLLESFELDPLPCATYKVKGVVIKKFLVMPNEINAIILRYEIENPEKRNMKIELLPLVNYRSIYSLTTNTFNISTIHGDVIELLYPDGSCLSLYSKETEFIENELPQEKRWYYNFYYSKDAEYKEACVEHCYNPGKFSLESNKKRIIIYLVAAYPWYEKLGKPKRFFGYELKRLKKLLKAFFKKNNAPKEDWIKWLVISLDKHLVKRYDNFYSIIAGYPWFYEWARDALICVPALLRCGKKDEVKSIIKLYLSRRKGLVPNKLESFEGESTAYNSADSSLLLIDAVYEYYKYTLDLDFVKEIWKDLKEIIESYIIGVEGIKMGEDYLINHPPDYTWMDTKYTPRTKAIEIQALWYNALKIMDFFAKKFNDISVYGFLAKKVEANLRKYWNGTYLKDCENSEELRPNQILALSLNYPVVRNDEAKSILKVVEQELLTSYGLRSLARSSSNYKGSYIGDYERDAAYHNGCVWPWLLCEYIKAKLRFDKNANKQELLKKLKDFVKKEIRRYGLGSISEIFDGDAEVPRGCISQAWSVAKILEAACILTES